MWGQAEVRDRVNLALAKASSSSCPSRRGTNPRQWRTPGRRCRVQVGYHLHPKRVQRAIAWQLRVLGPSSIGVGDTCAVPHGQHSRIHMFRECHAARISCRMAPISPKSVSTLTSPPHGDPGPPRSGSRANLALRSRGPGQFSAGVPRLARSRL